MDCDESPRGRSLKTIRNTLLSMAEISAISTRKSPPPHDAVVSTAVPAAPPRTTRFSDYLGHHDPERIAALSAWSAPYRAETVTARAKTAQQVWAFGYRSVRHLRSCLQFDDAAGTARSGPPPV